MGRSRAWTQRRKDQTDRLLTAIDMGLVKATGLWWDARTGQCLQHQFLLGDEDVTLAIRRLLRLRRAELVIGPGTERSLRVVDGTLDTDWAIGEIGEVRNVKFKEQKRDHNLSHTNPVIRTSRHRRSSDYACPALPPDYPRRIYDPSAVQPKRRLV